MVGGAAIVLACSATINAEKKSYRMLWPQKTVTFQPKITTKFLSGSVEH